MDGDLWRPVGNEFLCELQRLGHRSALQVLHTHLDARGMPQFPFEGDGVLALH